MIVPDLLLPPVPKPPTTDWNRLPGPPPAAETADHGLEPSSCSSPYRRNHRPRTGVVVGRGYPKTLERRRRDPRVDEGRGRRGESLDGADIRPPKWGPDPRPPPSGLSATRVGSSVSATSVVPHVPGVVPTDGSTLVRRLRGTWDVLRGVWDGSRGTWDVGRAPRDVGRGTGSEGRGTGSEDVGRAPGDVGRAPTVGCETCCLRTRTPCPRHPSA